MQPRHLMMALAVAAIWGFNFVVIKVALANFPPLFLVAIRFAIAALPALFLPRPAISWRQLILISMTLFLGQYGFLFPAIAYGMPPGLASIVLQIQAFLTILIAALFLRERPSMRQISGTITAGLGLLVIGINLGGDVTGLGLGLTLASALSWAFGNVLLRRAGKVDMLPMIVWLSLIPPLPLLGLSFLLEGPVAINTAIHSVTWLTGGAALYIAFISTIVGFAFWGYLLKVYPAGTVAPFALLVPIFGAVSSALLLGEKFGSARLLGMILVMTGLVIVAFPWPWQKNKGSQDKAKPVLAKT
ncbi:MAG: EamA family transporter [Alphaproteobacteria bacterium]